jgi:uncharacterized cupin superfamily protein
VTESSPLDPVAALAVPVDLQPVPTEQVLDGEPTAGLVVLGEFEGLEYGVWEMSPGSMSDVENAEFFVVLAGAASVEFIDTETTVQLVPGSVLTLEAGARTIWTVTQSLRKVWVAV